jgi:hypothetical protein
MVVAPNAVVAGCSSNFTKASFPEVGQGAAVYIISDTTIADRLWHYALVSQALSHAKIFEMITTIESHLIAAKHKRGLIFPAMRVCCLRSQSLKILESVNAMKVEVVNSIYNPVRFPI